jgi:tyrosyl-tRNA synthetase
MSKEAYGITFPLITTASGAKMGKTAEGAVWLSAQKTSPYDFFQYWVNVDDRDVGRFLKLYTFLPMDEIRKAESLEGQELNACKTVLAFEVTRIVHGQEAALEAYEAAAKVFGRRTIPWDLLPSSGIPRDLKVDEGAAVPTTPMSPEELEAGIPAFELFARVGLCESKSAARRLIQQGGAYLNGQRISRFDQPIQLKDLQDGAALLRAGKKKVHRICVEG